MFEKFTERARCVMSLARKEAQRLNSEFIGTEHILLGLVQEGGGVGAKVLKNLNVDPKRIRQECERLITPSVAPVVTLGQIPFSPRGKRVIELAGECANQLKAEVTGTEHLLLGLIKENEGIASQVLVNLGLKLEEVKDMVLEVLGEAGQLVPPKKHPVCSRCKGSGKEPGEEVVPNCAVCQKLMVSVGKSFSEAEPGVWVEGWVCPWKDCAGYGATDYFGGMAFGPDLKLTGNSQTHQKILGALAFKGAKS
jgi:hypothetical protein